MNLSDKLRGLRDTEGKARGLGRALTQGELVRALLEEQGRSLSQSYLSQIESGARPHLTNTSRLLLARFFKVHPGYLVDDPEEDPAQLFVHAKLPEDRLDSWLAGGAEHFRRDIELRAALLTIAQYEDTRRALLLLANLLEAPDLAGRVLAHLGSETSGSSNSKVLRSASDVTLHPSGTGDQA